MKFFSLLLIIMAISNCGKSTTKQNSLENSANSAYNEQNQDSDYGKDTILIDEKDFYSEYIETRLDSIDHINFLRMRFEHIQTLNNTKLYDEAYNTSLMVLKDLNSEKLNSYSTGLIKGIYDEMNFAIQMHKNLESTNTMYDIYSTGYFADNFLQTTQKKAIPRDSILNLIDKMEFPKNIDIVINDDVIYKMNKFLTSWKRTLIKWNENKTMYDEKITPILLSYNIPHEIIYIAMIESGYKYSAVSRTKAVGMWQFMPRTAKGLGAKINYWEDDRRDFIKATHLASNFLSYLYSKYDNWLLAFAAYNCGGGRVDRLLKKHGGRSVWDIYHYLPRETRNYVTSYLAVTLLSENLDVLGIEIKQKNIVDYKTTIVDGGTLLSYIARCSDTTTKAIKNLNPQYRVGATPTNQNEVIIKIPPDKYDSFVKKYKKEKGKRKKGTGKVVIVTHTVRSGDSLYKLAKIYKTSVNNILSANTIRNSAKIKPGMKIVIPVPTSAIR